MVIRVLVDADLILEALLNRSCFVEDVQELLERHPLIQIYMTNVGLKRVSILSRCLQNTEIAEEVDDWLREIMQPCFIDRSILEEVRSSPLRDFESAVEIVCATSLNLDALVTHKPDDFAEARDHFPVWSVANLLERVALETRTQSSTAYSLLVRDLLRIQRSMHLGNELNFDEVEELDEYQALEFLDSIVRNVLNHLITHGGTHSTQIRRLIDLGVSHFRAGDLKAALHSFVEAGQSDPMDPRVLLGMARTYKGLGCYIEAFVFALSALSNATHDQHRSYAHSLIAGIYHELFVHTHRVAYEEEAINFYTLARHELPTDVLPIWNCISSYICIFRNADNLTEAQRQHYLEQARNHVFQLKDVAAIPESNFARNKENIIADAERVCDDLGACWDNLIDELKNWDT